MSFEKGIEINEKGVEIIKEKKNLLWSEIQYLKINYKSYKNELGYGFTYVIP